MLKHKAILTCSYVATNHWLNSRLGTHLIAASSLWAQLGVESKVQENRDSSVPVQPRSSKCMGPVPAPNVLCGPEIAVLSVKYNDNSVM